MTPRILKYPRTAHLEGSAVQAGDDDLARVPFSSLRPALAAGARLIVEEKLDGANAGVWFDDDGALVLQSRGHALVGGGRERHFDGFKAWARARERALLDVLGRRYLLYGEWLYAKHTVFYDALPAWFVAFDVYDRERGSFLPTPRWRSLLDGTDVHAAPLLHDGARPLTSLAELLALLGRSRFITEGWRAALSEEAAATPHVDVERTLADTDPSGAMEGLYLKLEDDERGVLDRLKWVRAGFLQVVVDSDSHWQSRPIVKNRVRGAPR